MRILDKMRRQYCVYWPPLGNDNYGEKLYGPPEELRVRWEDLGEIVLEFDGKEFVPRHTVYVGEDLEELGKLLFVRLAELTSQNPPEEAMIIRKFEKTPTLKANKFLRIAYL